MSHQNTQRLSLNETAAFLAANRNFASNGYRMIARNAIRKMLQMLNEEDRAAALKASGVDRLPFTSVKALQTDFDADWTKEVQHTLPPPEVLIVPRSINYTPSRVATLAGFMRPAGRPWCAYVGMHGLVSRPHIYIPQYESKNLRVSINFAEALLAGSAKALWVSADDGEGNKTQKSYSMRGFADYCDEIPTDVWRAQQADYLDMIQFFVDLGWL